MASVLAERRLIRLIFDDNSSGGSNFHENNITQSSSQMAESRRNDNKRDFPPASENSHLKYAHHKASWTSSIATCVSFSVFLSLAQLPWSPKADKLHSSPIPFPLFSPNHFWPIFPATWMRSEEFSFSSLVVYSCGKRLLLRFLFSIFFRNLSSNKMCSILSRKRYRCCSAFC